MPGDGPLDLHLVALDLLDIAVEALDTIPLLVTTDENGDPLTLQGAPDRQLVSPGAPVWDCCDMIAVHVQQVTDKYASEVGALDKVNVPQLILTSTRCIPEGTMTKGKYKAPSLAALQAKARQVNVDGWALWNHVYNAIRANTFLTRCTQVRFNSMAQVTPTGGCAGWQLSFTVMLDGYAETFGS